jgi:HEAT repeat protein
MPSFSELQALVDVIRARKLPIAEIRKLLHHESPLVRVNALEAIVDPARQDLVLLNDLKLAASDPLNNVRLMGTVSVAHVAVACLIQIGTSDSLLATRQLLEKWPEPDRKDLIWYLESEGLSPPVAQITAAT